jgi:glycosyltransferase involved in cell wall biosynthesis
VVEAGSLEGMTVSIIICTCNRAQHLQQTLLAMGRVHVPAGVQAEVLVVDNGSKMKRPS